MEIDEDKKKPDASNMRVRVAIRIRPMSSREQAKEQSTCITGYPGNRLLIGTDRQFKFDSVFAKDIAQERVYRQCVHSLVVGCFDGYNAAVLAYGQTGSGKTYTMGTANVGVSEEQLGIIPRVIRDLFAEMEKRRAKVDFVIKASFLEIYNEQIIDLLGNEYLLRDPNDRVSNTAAIRQEKDGSISIYGICEQTVQTVEQMFALLERGATHRSTACTLMNDSSSRSHAIFTVFIEQHFIQDLNKTNPAEVDEGFVTAKFHFVDLAGSERIKKTGATGSTLKEGININLGLLCLGNVISALTDPDKKGGSRFVPYRDSKLTRILQDSLGGNSNTYMIACVSPAESNYEQSLSTLKYAARAMNIKNTPVVNRDPQSALISQLKQKLFEAETQNKKMRALLSQSGTISEEALAQLTSKHKDGFVETNRQEAQQLKRTIMELQQRIAVISEQLTQEKNKANSQELEVLESKRDRDMLRLQIDELLRDNPQLRISPITQYQMSVLETQLQTIQQLKNQLIHRDSQFGQLQEQFQNILKAAKRDQEILIAKTKEVYELKKEVVEMHRKKLENNDYSRYDQNTARMSHYQPQITSRADNDTMRMSYQQGMIPRSQTIYEDNFLNRMQFPGIPLPSDRQYVDDPSQISFDQTFIQQSHQFEQHNQNYNTEINTMSHQIKEREKLLKQITNTQIDLEYQLINSMKEEYHKKIVGLERQKDKLERELATVSKNKDEKIQTMIERDKAVITLKEKKEELEGQLKQFRKKQKEQHGLQKLVQDQKNKIGDMNKEIKNFKLQKLELSKKLKEDKDKFEKFKTQRYKELLSMKKLNIEKDNQIKKMSRQTTKAQQIVVKKEQQARQLKRMNDTLKQILDPKSSKPNKRATVNHHPANNSQINYEQIVSRVIQRMQLDIQRQIQGQKYSEQLKSIETQLDQYLNKDCKLKVDFERLLMGSKLCEIQIQKLQLDDQIKEIKNNLNETHSAIQSLQDKLSFTKTKLANVYTAEVPKMDIDLEIVYNKAYDTVESMRRFLRLFLQKLQDLLDQENRNNKHISQLKQQVQSLTQKQSQMDEQIIRMNIEHQEALAQLRQQLLMMTSYIEEQPQQFPTSTSLLQIPSLNTPRKSTDDKNQKRYYERQIGDLNKKVKQITLERDQFRRKFDVLTSKYENVKKLGNKDKFIGLTEDVKIPTLKEKRMERNSITPVHTSTLATLNSSTMLLDEVSDMWSGLNTTSSVSNLSRFKVHSYEERRIHTEYDEKKEQLNQWDCIGTLQGHANPVQGLACFSNCLISTSMKNLKLWDLESQKVISDIGGQHLNGIVKPIGIDPERRLMVTACDRNIAVWDFLNMKVIETLKGHKDQIRALHIKDGLLFSGGKGTGNTPSLFTWDFRSSNPVDEKQRNQDILSITSYRNTLYYGTRNHQVRRMNLQNMEVIAPFENPHFDAVTGLTILNSYLISGSKDKNLKLWNLESPSNHYRYTSYGHNDYINCVIRKIFNYSGDQLISVFYSGSKDGYMKAGIVSKDKIEVVGSMNCHTQSINALCPFEQSDNICGFVSGSSDKTIKLWQANSETIENLQTQILYDNS